MRRRDKLSRAIDQLFSTEKTSTVVATSVPEPSAIEQREMSTMVQPQEFAEIEEGDQPLSLKPSWDSLTADEVKAPQLPAIEEQSKLFEEKKQELDPIAKLSPSSSDEQLVVFGLGDGMYGLPVEKVEAIIKMQPITRVPKTPSFIRGVTNLRGAVLPVIDLNVRLGRTQAPESTATRIIVVRSSLGLAGLVVDRVDSVRQVPANLIEPPPPMTRSVHSAYLRGVARLENDLVLLLDLDSLLQSAGTRGIGKGFYGTRPAQATLSAGNSTR